MEDNVVYLCIEATKCSSTINYVTMTEKVLNLFINHFRIL